MFDRCDLAGEAAPADAGKPPDQRAPWRAPILTRFGMERTLSGTGSMVDSHADASFADGPP
jgi:hypothetical protein